jgi:hypothetical protein
MKVLVAGHIDEDGIIGVFHSLDALIAEINKFSWVEITSELINELSAEILYNDFGVWSEWHEVKE